MRVKKYTWTGARLCDGLPKEFGDFVDYARGDEYEGEFDYERWKHSFGVIFEELGFSDSDGSELGSAAIGDIGKGYPEEAPSACIHRACPSIAYPTLRPKPHLYQLVNMS
jgi:hypothetical protein